LDYGIGLKHLVRLLKTLCGELVKSLLDVSKLNKTMKSLDKNKTKELEWIKDWKQLNPNWTEVQISFIGSLLQDLEEEIRVQQRTELLEEIKTRIDTWGGFEDDGGNLCHYDSEILEWVNNLLNKKND
jgi:hypothetical protein